MAKIQRKQQKIFAGLANTDEKAVFGSMKTGTPVYSDDIEQLQSADYEQGWQNAIVLEKAPFLEEMNGVQYGLSSQIAYLLQQGIPEWDSETTYYTNGFCSYNGVIYRSLVDENIGNIPSSTQLSWEEFTSGSEGDSLNDKITNCILSNSGASITKQDYTQESYVNKDCTVSETNVVSGFAATAYIILNKTFTNSSAFTFTIPFTLNSITGVQPLVAINDTANSIAVVNGVLRFNYMGETLSGSTSLAASTAYTLQFIRTDNGYTVQIKSAVDDEYTQEINLPSSLDYFSGKTVYLGSDRVNALNGTIDLANTSIQADSATYWDINTLLDFQTVTLSGALDTLMPDGRKEDLTLNNLEQTVALDTTLLLNNSTGNTKTILVKDNNEVMIRDNYTESDNEPAGAVSGDVWLDTSANIMKEQQVVLPNLLNSGCSFYDGVASGFSQTNYLSLPSSYDLGGNWSISLPVNIQTNEDNDKNVILGDLTEDDGSILPESVAVVYDGDETVTAYLRRADVYGATKRTVTSTAYTVTKGDSTGYVSVEGTAESYVPASTQVYADSMMTIELEVAAANTWTYTGDSTENITTQSGYVKSSGSVFVPSGTQVYTTADLTTPLEVASGSDWIYTGATSPSLIGALNVTVEEGANTLTIAYNGTNYTFNNQTLASTDTVKDDFVVYLGSAPSTPNAYFNSTIDIANAEFSFWSWNGISDIKPNFNIAGSLSFTNGVLSGFSASNYATLPAAFNPGSEPWEMVWNATTGASTNVDTRICSINNVYGVHFGIQNDSHWKIWLSTSGTSWDLANGQPGTYTLLPNTTYWVKIAWDGSNYTVAYSLTGEAGSYITDITVASTSPLQFTGNTAGIGNLPLGNAPWDGSINLKNSYIKINDETWWRWNGITEAGYSWQEFPAAKIGEVTMKSEVVQPNYTVVGSPSITDEGIVSGFSTANYLTLGTFYFDGGSFEYQQKLTTPAANVSTTTTCFLGIGGQGNVLCDCVIYNGTPSYYASANGSTWAISDQRATSTLAISTLYYARIRYDGTNLMLDFSSNGSEWQNYITRPFTYTAGNYTIGLGSWQEYDGTRYWYFSGSQDLSGLQLKIGDNVVYKWNGYTEPITFYSPNQAAINYPVELVKKDDFVAGLSEVRTEISNLNQQVDIQGKAYVTETYVSGNSWYRVYSDGFCVQGSWLNTGSTQYRTDTIAFMKTYRTTLNVVAIMMGPGGGSDSNQGVGGWTTTNFTYTHRAWGSGVTWVAFGYV